MTKALRQWQTSPQPSGQALTDIGTPLRSISPQPGYPTGPLPGSLRGPVSTKTAAEPPGGRVVRVTRGPSYTHDARIQCAPGERPFGAGFSAVGLGRDVTTGRRWA